MLYFVATPIGNLKDISFRAIEVLKSVDIIACEDTRKSLILLTHYNIKKRLISYHKNNEQSSSNGIIALLKKGKNIAVISDSGMPSISDPGCMLVRKLIESNLAYSIIPGANAGITALALSGFSTQRFMFIGFLPEKTKDKVQLFENIKNLNASLIFYIAPHNLTKDLQVIFQNLGDKNCCLVKELTKFFEKTFFFNLSNIPKIEPKGEFVLVVENKQTFQNKLENLTIKEQILFYENSGLTQKEAIKKVAKENKIKNIYKFIEKNQENS